MRIRLFMALVIGASVVGSACLDDSITGTRPLTLAVSVTPDSVGVNETVAAQYSATGTGLLGIVVDWGDGAVDSVDLRGTAVTASGQVEHEYTAEGSYVVSGTAEDQSGPVTSSANVRVR